MEPRVSKTSMDKESDNSTKTSESKASTAIRNIDNAWVAKCQPWLNEEGILYERQDVSNPPLKDFFVVWVDPYQIHLVVWEIKSPYHNPNANKKGAFSFHIEYNQFKTDNVMRGAIECRASGELEFLDSLLAGNINLLDRMPEDIQLRIVSFLDIKSVGTLSRCSPYYKKLCYSDELWCDIFSHSYLKKYMTPGLLELTKTQGWRLCYVVALRIMVKYKSVPLSKAERRFREKRNADPERREAYLQAEKDKYAKDKTLGRKKLVKDMTPREHRWQQKAWRKRYHNSKLRHSQSAPSDVAAPAAVQSTCSSSISHTEQSGGLLTSTSRTKKRSRQTPPMSRTDQSSGRSTPTSCPEQSSRQSPSTSHIEQSSSSSHTHQSIAQARRSQRKSQIKAPDIAAHSDQSSALSDQSIASNLKVSNTAQSWPSTPHIVTSFSRQKITSLKMKAAENEALKQQIFTLQKKMATSQRRIRKLVKRLRRSTKKSNPVGNMLTPRSKTKSLLSKENIQVRGYKSHVKRTLEFHFAVMDEMKTQCAQNKNASLASVAAGKVLQKHKLLQKFRTEVNIGNAQRKRNYERKSTV